MIENKIYCDYLIVGSGIAGNMLSFKLPKKSKVIILEKGDEKLNFCRNKKKIGSVKNFGNFPIKDYLTEFTSLKVDKGNSYSWSGWLMPFDKNDLKKWPITYEELSKYYNKVIKFLKIQNFNEKKNF